jgi:hypothetical protein
MQITVRVQHQYGTKWIYPVCDKAKLFANIAQQKTLNASVDSIKKLGYQIIIEAMEI